MPAIDIGSRREVLWDDYLVDTAATDTRVTLHHPQPREVVCIHDAPWEGDGCDYHCIVEENGGYRMYYLGWETAFADQRSQLPRPIVVAMLESRDGLHWDKPSLGLREFNGSRDNNIILDGSDNTWDNFAVFKDPRPNCPEEERYKGIAEEAEDRTLWCWTSRDGLHFTRGWLLTEKGLFDSLNIAFWDETAQLYRCYLRDFHKKDGQDFLPGEEIGADAVRDIRQMTSPDFRHWTTPERLEFLPDPDGLATDFPLYTNVVQTYQRAPHMLVGFPSRYIERPAWSPSFDHLPGADLRRARSDITPRYGLTITDCIFMCSRDGEKWTRFEEALLSPGPERPHNWVYGDMYPALGLIPTPSTLPGAAPELSMYIFENHWTHRPAALRRYSIRQDGFVSRSAGYLPRRLTTKPLIYQGQALELNLATSAAGSLVVEIQSASGAQKTVRSAEIFGDSPARLVDWTTGTLASLEGQPVRLTFTLCDAHLYSLKFT